MSGVFRLAAERHLKTENGIRNLSALPGDFSPRSVPLRDVPLPEAGEIHAWYLDLREMAASLQAALDGPQATGGKPAFTSGQLRFARRFFLRLLLGAYLGIPGKSVKIIRGLRGKPVLDPVQHGKSLHFSMAKSADRLLIGISGSVQVGVDLEPEGRRAHNALGVARRYFSADEAQALQSIPSERLNRAFLHTWACKEAVVKASGKGIANELCRFTVDIDPDRQPAVLEFDNEQAGDWSLALMQPEPGYLGAVAVHGIELKLNAFRLCPAGSSVPP